MLPNRGHLPLEAVRDLIGLCRALYASWQAAGVGRARLEALERIGRDLRAAYRMARKHAEPDTMGHRSAWAKAERATQELGRLLWVVDRIEPVVTAAVERLRRG